MNIVHELNQLEYGGVEKVIRNLIKFDSENKHRVITYKDGPFKKEFEAIGAEVIFMPKEGTIDLDADILHVHSGGAVSEMAMSLGKAFTVIETIHSPIRSPMTKEFITQRVGVTEVVSRMNENCVTIHNGVDFSTLMETKTREEIRAELGIDNGATVVGRLGRVGKDKCMEEWILACYYLQQRGINIVPMIVGAEAQGLDGYIGKLKLMAASLPVKNIIWAGHKDDVANYLQAMDVFLYPSPTEGFGLVFIEAINAGCVVVTYKNDITMELLGGYSILTEKSIEGLVAGVTKAMDVSMRDAIIPIAQEWIIENYSAERMAKDYQDLYKKYAKERVMA
jgi:glycosyltransferase involved in cell wall biosynthesis